MDLLPLVGTECCIRPSATAALFYLVFALAWLQAGRQSPLQTLADVASRVRSARRTARTGTTSPGATGRACWGATTRCGGGSARASASAAAATSGPSPPPARAHAQWCAGARLAHRRASSSWSLRLSWLVALLMRGSKRERQRASGAHRCKLHWEGVLAGCTDGLSERKASCGGKASLSKCHAAVSRGGDEAPRSSARGLPAPDAAPPLALTLCAPQEDVACEYGYEFAGHDCRPIVGIDTAQCAALAGYQMSETHRRLVAGDACADVALVIPDTDGRGHAPGAPPAAAAGRGHGWATFFVLMLARTSPRIRPIPAQASNVLHSFFCFIVLGLRVWGACSAAQAPLRSACASARDCWLLDGRLQCAAAVQQGGFGAARPVRRAVSSAPPS